MFFNLWSIGENGSQSLQLKTCKPLRILEIIVSNKKMYINAGSNYTHPLSFSNNTHWDSIKPKILRTKDKGFILSYKELGSPVSREASHKIN